MTDPIFFLFKGIVGAIRSFKDTKYYLRNKIYELLKLNTGKLYFERIEFQRLHK